MNLQYFFEKNSLMIIFLVSVLASGICVWAYLDFSKDMQNISDFMDLSGSKQDGLEISEATVKQLSSNSDSEIDISSDIIKNISTSLKSKTAKEITISADVLKSLSSNKQ